MISTFSRIVVILFTALIIVQCSENKNITSVAKNKIDINSYSVLVLTSPADGNYIKPVFIENDSAVVFLLSDLSSIWKRSLFNPEPVLIYKSKYKISEFVSLINAETVFAIEKSFTPDAEIKSRIVEIINGNAHIALQSSESIHNLSLTSNNNLVFMINDSVRFFDRTSKSVVDKTNDDYELINIDSTSINFIGKSRSDKINLTHHQNVVWVNKISQDSILIYSPQDKLILLSFRLKDIVRLGDYQNPKYNSSQKILAFLKTIDDGLRETSSDIFLVRLNHKEEINITRSPKDIESNISWSNDGTKLAFDVNGQIKIISFNYKNPKTK